MGGQGLSLPCWLSGARHKLTEGHLMIMALFLNAAENCSYSTSFDISQEPVSKSVDVAPWEWNLNWAVLVPEYDCHSKVSVSIPE